MSITEHRGYQPIGSVDTSMADRAGRMVERALSYCESKMGCPGHNQVAKALRIENPQVHDYFRYSLARQTAEYLAHLDSDVLGVYTHSYGDLEEEGEDRSCSLVANISLILHVRRKTAALASAITSLDHALLEQYKSVVAPGADKMASLLDVQIADDHDVAEGIGFGAVLKSAFTKPTRIL